MNSYQQQARDSLQKMKYVVGRVLHDAKYADRLTANQIREKLDLPNVHTPDGRPNILIVGVLMVLEDEGLAESIKHKGWQLTEAGIEWIETTMFHEGIAISSGDAKHMH